MRSSLDKTIYNVDAVCFILRTQSVRKIKSNLDEKTLKKNEVSTRNLAEELSLDRLFCYQTFWGG